MKIQSIHPKAFLTRKRNVRNGLQSRSLIVNCLERGSKKTAEIAEELRFSYPKVAHHLKLLVNERSIASSDGKRPHMWYLTEYGQRRLVF